MLWFGLRRQPLCPPAHEGAIVSMMDLDLSSPLLSPRDADLLRALLDKRMSYAAQGRGREAHGVSAALLIVWQAVTQADIPIDVTDTGHLAP
jgi:hypothetical protein